MFGKKKTDTIDDVLNDLGVIPEVNINHNVKRVSEKLCDMDKFFHSCWLKLKFERPDLFDAMAEVELFIAGYEREPEKDTEDADDTEDEGKIL